jgi:hypothetical protein
MIFTAPATYEARDGRKAYVSYISHGNLLHGYWITNKGTLDTSKQAHWTIAKGGKFTHLLEGDYAFLCFERGLQGRKRYSAFQIDEFPQSALVRQLAKGRVSF